MLSPLPARDARIDGLRGLSILFVIAGHLAFYRLGSEIEAVPLRELLARPSVAFAVWMDNLGYRLARDLFLNMAALGVKIFFVISGYLITSLLVAEQQRTGQISLAAFYTRRAFRILPAYYLMLATTVALGLWHVIKLPPLSAVQSALFTCNVTDCGWWLGHTWSLAVEEQFYLAWPLVLIWSGRRRAAVVIAIAAVLTLLSMMLQLAAAFTCIAVGALVAMRPDLREWIARLPSSVPMAAGAMVLLLPMLELLPGGAVLGGAATPWLAGVLVFSALAGRGPLAPAAASPALRELGLMSYSLYLWQQMSLAPVLIRAGPVRGDLYDSLGLFTLGIMLIIGPLSYRLIEQPAQRLGRQIAAAMTKPVSGTPGRGVE